MTSSLSSSSSQVISQDSVVAKGFDNLQKAVDHAGSLGEENSYRIANPGGLGGGSVAGAGIPAVELDRHLSKRMTGRIEANWGEMSRFVVSAGTVCVFGTACLLSLCEYFVPTEGLNVQQDALYFCTLVLGVVTPPQGFL